MKAVQKPRLHWRECPKCQGAGCKGCRKGYLPVLPGEIGYENAIEDAP